MFQDVHYVVLYGYAVVPNYIQWAYRLQNTGRFIKPTLVRRYCLHASRLSPKQTCMYASAHWKMCNFLIWEVRIRLSTPTSPIEDPLKGSLLFAWSCDLGVPFRKGRSHPAHCRSGPVGPTSTGITKIKIRRMYDVYSDWEHVHVFASVKE